ncbi:MAG: hypothetical protein JNL98_32900 [Bryobacterales bacterium]|nr:hypothetical protein [Bryobacterales bacterium]
MPDEILRALNRCNPNEALRPGDDRFVDLDDIRGIAVQSKMMRLLEAADGGDKYAHIAFAGHRGGGKSTELFRVIERARDQGYVTLYAGVTEEIDPDELAFGDVFRLMASKLEHEFGDLAENHEQVRKAFENVEQWFREVTLLRDEQETRDLRFGFEAGLGGQVDAEAGLPVAKFKTGLGKILAAIGVQRQSLTKESTEIRSKVERYPQGLQENLNLLLGAIRRAKECRGILFVLDNVDRYSPELVNSVFLRNSALFTGIEAHLIFTVPISLLYSPPEDSVHDRYTSATLPMIPVFVARSRTLDESVVRRMQDAVYARVPKNLFAAEELVREMIRLSGGCWRDLLRLLHAALLETVTRIGEPEVKRATLIVRGELARPLTQDQYRVLVKVSQTKQLDPSPENQKLLFQRAVLEYNGEGWFDVHPLLEDARQFQDALASGREVTQ